MKALQKVPRSLILKTAERYSLFYFAKQIKPNLELCEFHKIYYSVLNKFADGEIKKLIIQIPPQHGKSEGSSRLIPAFMLGQNPNLKICIASYSTTIARDFNLDVQRILETDIYKDIFQHTRLNGDGVNVQNYTRTKDVFEIPHFGGSLRAVGRGGSLTSKTVDVSILDDVYKDYAEGNSPIIREAAWKWYTTVVRTRLHNNSRELIVFTRWHEDDLIGRLEKSGERIVNVNSWADFSTVGAADWVRLNFPALKVGEPTEFDPRREGEALWESRHSKTKLLQQKELDPVQFECLFQGNPISAAGLLYHDFKTYVSAADFGMVVRSGSYTDVADEGDDFLCSIAYDVVKSDNTIFNEKTKKVENIIFVLVRDIIFTQDNIEVTSNSVPLMWNVTGTECNYIESNNGGSGFYKIVSRKTLGHCVQFSQTANKESRILTCAGGVNNQIIFPLGWETRWEKFYFHVKHFLRNFKANKHDDGVDTLTGIYEKEILTYNPGGYNNIRKGIKRRN